MFKTAFLKQKCKKIIFLNVILHIVHKKNIFAKKSKGTGTLLSGFWINVLKLVK